MSANVRAADEAPLSWGDIYGDSPQQVVELDVAGKAILDLIPADKRDEMEPLLRPMLGQMQVMLGPDNYARFCADMTRAYDAHVNGKSDEARVLFEAYGIPYDVLTNQLAS